MPTISRLTSGVSRLTSGFTWVTSNIIEVTFGSLEKKWKRIGEKMDFWETWLKNKKINLIIAGKK